MLELVHTNVGLTQVFQEQLYHASSCAVAHVGQK